ncbi:MAG: PSD1 domain-containing protein [Verrucomicrobia bacterium]|nr:PSD1 domain-containing protein [Verrucomicrobiota bacterium]
MPWPACRCRIISCQRRLVFVRAINLNGPALVVDGRAWDGTDATNVTISGKRFENQAVALKPATDPKRAQMIRSSVWGDKVSVELTGLGEGAHQVFLYVWEDTINEQFDLLVNDHVVFEKFNSGTAGSWRKLGPWKCESREGKIKVSARAPGHGAANFSGIELWAGDGAIPELAKPQFVTTLTPEHMEFFERKIRPVLVEHCYECHSSGAKKIKGGLVLDSRAGVMKGGDTGAAITPGDPEASLLIQAMRHADPALVMPKQKLPDHVIADFETWVKMGAPDPRIEDTVAVAQAKSAIDWNKAREWWSFRPLKAPPVPGVKQKRWAKNDLDRFILARLEKENLKPAPDAEKRVLIRRATFDLTGLPPTPEEIEAFLKDKSRDAFAKVVDRLLASPSYGERWGRHWLDVVRYADTAGDNSDFPIPQMHRYRDWVISAFNRDLPYDQFVREQLAGDLLPGKTTQESHDRLIATGYIANARRFGSRVDDYPQHLTIEDTLDNLGKAFLGLTINCARCHDHKFDPIPTADYYALYGIFNSTRYPWPGIELEQKQRDLVPLVETGKLAEAEAARKPCDAEKGRLERRCRSSRTSSRKSRRRQEGARGQDQGAEQAVKEFVKKAALLSSPTLSPRRSELGTPPSRSKATPAKPGDVVPRRFLTVLGAQSLPPNETSSGRRQLADWIADYNNPLAARVMANRIWQYHFGKGLVPTPNDFGKQGKPPTHPELLDWLASQFIESGWSMKAMHRLIMRSRTYQLASTRSDDAIARDANNDLLCSFPRRRLDAESIRDTLLVLGGNLDTSPPKPHPFPPQTEWKFTQHNPFKAVYESKRRSVYLMTQRIQRHPYLAIFDGADPSTSTAARTTSTTPLQALFLLNDKFVHEQSQAFAARVVAAAESDEARFKFACQTALGRPAEREELDRGLAFLNDTRTKLRESGAQSEKIESESWQAMVRVLFRLNEFVYLD